MALSLALAAALAIFLLLALALNGTLWGGDSQGNFYRLYRSGSRLNNEERCRKQ